MNTYKANITTDELKTIAATSAIAAAGTAVATAIVTYALDKWIFKEDEADASSEPTFVVVPVVERSVPPLPPGVPSLPPSDPTDPIEPPTSPSVAGYGLAFGELSDAQLEEIRRLMPWRYWHEFYRCYDHGDPAYMTPECSRLNKMYASASEEDKTRINDMVTSAPYVGRTEFIVYLALAGGLGIAAGMLAGTAIR